MIKIEETYTSGFEPAIRGMRNAMNSWDRLDSPNISHLEIGPGDYDLMLKLARGGPTHAKYRRMITVYADITAPLYWWKEYDTYKIGTVANSCSTMHKIHENKFTLDDFSCEHLENCDILVGVIGFLNSARKSFIATKDKKYWWQMIQALPSSYNQKRTVMLNYEVLSGLYPTRKSHKLDEWVDFCKWIEALPHSEIITVNKNKENENE